METGRFGLRSSALIVCNCVNNSVHSLAGGDSTSWWRDGWWRDGWWRDGWWRVEFLVATSLVTR